MPRITFRAWIVDRVGRALLQEGGFLISDAASLTLACYVAAHLWYRTGFPPVVWALVGAAWLLGWTTGVARVTVKPIPGSRIRPRWLPPFLAAVTGALTLKFMVHPFSWPQAAAFGVLLGITSSLTRLMLGLIRRRRSVGTGEGLRLAGAQGVALFAVHPYLRSALIGAGDASSYSLMVADFRAQWQAGIFPVLIGQSPFAFNGGFQPIRNAPYLPYLSGLIDLLTLGTLNEFALLNLTVLVSMIGAITGCYAALRLFMPRAPWVALALAILYGLSPGVLAPLYGGDMFPTFMTLPFLPWLFLGLAESAVQPGKLWPWALQAVALAAIWMGHPPVAAWATLLAGFAAAWTLVREHRWEVARQQGLAGLLFLGLSEYLVASVLDLHLPAVSRASALDTIGYKLSILRENWRGSFLPVSARGTRLLGDVQLGYGLWLCVALALPGALGHRTGRKLLGCFALLLLFTWPIPYVTELAWRLLPTQLLVVTNQWPVERFYVLLAALSVFLVASAIREARVSSARMRWSAGSLLLLACLWSATETRKFFVRAADTALTYVQSEDMHLPEGIVVSRTHSNEYLGTPLYFSYGHMDPRLEIRLLDLQTHEAFADGSSLRPGWEGVRPPVQVLTLQESTIGTLADPILLKSGQAVILRFDFEGNHPDGELQLLGEHLHYSYTLPMSGLSKAFGSEPENAKTLVLENSTGDPEHVSLVFLRRTGNRPGVRFGRVAIEPLADSTRAIRLDSLIPFRVHVSAVRGGYLESPRLFVPGYRATVDGRAAPVSKSRSGLVAVRVDRGEHEVVVSYPGCRILRWSFFGTTSAWIFLIGFVGNRLFHNRSLSPHLGSAPKSGANAIRHRWRLPLVVWVPLATAAAALGTVLLARHAIFGPPAPSGFRLVLRLPLEPLGTTEPLLTSGHPGAGDFIYVTYVDGTHLVVGHDKWSYGGAKSLPFLVEPDREQTLEVDLGGSAPSSSTAPPRPLSVSWNGTLLFTDPLRFYPLESSEVTFGKNLIGGSTTSSSFSGEILLAEPIAKP